VCHQIERTGRGIERVIQGEIYFEINDLFATFGSGPDIRCKDARLRINRYRSKFRCDIKICVRIIKSQ